MATDASPQNQVPSPDDKLVSYRLDQLQLGMQALNGQLASLSTQILTLQTSLPDRYMTRMEFAEILRQKEIQQDTINHRLDAMEAHGTRQDEALKDLQTRAETRGWGVAAALFTGIIGLIVGALNLVERMVPPH